MARSYSTDTVEESIARMKRLLNQVPAPTKVNEMTESEWLASEDPAAMLRHVEGKVSDRKLGLFACACLAASNKKLLATRKYGTFDYGEEGENIKADMPLTVCREWCNRQDEYDPPQEVKAALLRDIFGNPFHPMPRFQRCVKDVTKPLGGNKVVPGHPDRTVIAVAQAAYDDRLVCQRCGGAKTIEVYEGALPDAPCPVCQVPGSIDYGTLDPVRLAVLADALEDVGCDDEAILDHLRSPGPHVRGCWAVDLVMGKS